MSPHAQYVKVGTIFGRSRRGRSWTGRVEGPGMMWNHFQSLDGNPLQYSCLENPRDREAWWAAIYGVTQSRTRLKWLSSSSFPSSILETFWPGGVHLVSSLFAFSYSSQGSPRKNTGVGCQFLLQWIELCQNFSLWPVHLGWCACHGS